MKKYNISKASQLLGVSTQTLRNWDKNNILKPSIVSEKGYRYYTDSDLASFLYNSYEFEKLDGRIDSIPVEKILDTMGIPKNYMTILKNMVKSSLWI